MDIEKRSGVQVLQPKGDLTIFEAAEFKDALLSLHEKEDPIELDLTDVERVDSSGIQLIVAGATMGRMAVTGMTTVIKEKMLAIGCEQWIGTDQKDEGNA